MLLSVLFLLFAAAIAASSAFHVIVTDGSFGFPYTGFQLAYAIADAEAKALNNAFRPVV